MVYQWFISRKTIIFQDFRGGPTFSRGVQLFPGGIQMLISIETHRTCDFPGGGGGGAADPLSAHEYQNLGIRHQVKWATPRENLSLGFLTK